MKLPIYDDQNEGRLLGYIFVDRPITGLTYNVAAVSIAMEAYSSMKGDDLVSPAFRARQVSFKVTFKSISNTNMIDWATSETVTLRRMVLTTAASLEDLMEIENFTLPGETRASANARRHRTADSRPYRT